MAQHDYSIANQGFPATRADINNVLSAIATNNSGTSAPSTQYAGQFWLDTTSSNWVLYIHDGADDIQFATIDTSANTVNFIDSALASDVVINTSGAITTTGAFTSVGIDDNATSTAITIDSSENVGIGTTNPAHKISIGTYTATSTATPDTISLGATYSSTAGQNLKLRLFYDNSTISHGFGISSGQIDYVASGAGVSHVWYSNSTERMRIDSSGNLLLDKTTTSNTTAGVRLGVGGVVAPSRTADAPIVASRLSTNGKVIEIRKDSTLVGNIGTIGELYISSGTSTGTGLQFNNANDQVRPCDASGNSRDNAITLGDATRRFKDLYLSGGIYVGGTGTANKLDDYEEGTFTVSNANGSVSGTLNFLSSRNELSYTKIGSLVNIVGLLEVYSVTGTMSGNYITITGLPFTTANLTDYANNASGSCAVESFGNPNGLNTVSLSYAESQTVFYVYKHTADGDWIAGAQNGTALRINFCYRAN